MRSAAEIATIQASRAADVADAQRIRELQEVARAALGELGRIIGSGRHGGTGADRLAEADDSVARVCSLAVRRLEHPDA